MNKLLINKRNIAPIQKVIIDAASFHFEQQYGPHKVIEYTVNWKYKDLNLYFHIIKAVIFFIIKSRKLSNIINYSIEGVNIGLPAFSTAMKTFKVYDSKIFLYYSVFKQFISAVRMYFFSTKIIKESQINSEELVVYIDDIAYLNSILFDSLMKSEVGVYTNKYPHGYMLYKNKKHTQISSAKYEYPKINESEEKYHDYMEKRLTNPLDFIPYLNADISVKIKKYKPKMANAQTVLIYPHSFTDAQLVYGYDGFLNMYEWLEFTLDVLIDKNVNIIVKGHPNYWAKNYESEVIEWDLKLWNRLQKKYNTNKYVEFIDFPVSNKDQLDSLDPKNTVVISHHGNAAVEAAYLGFKSISSSCSIWGNEYYSFCETWSTREEYKEILCNLQSIEYPNEVKLKNFVSDRYMYKYAYHGKFMLLSIVSREIGIPIKDLITAPSLVTIDKFKDYEGSIKKISSAIHEFSY